MAAVVVVMVVGRSWLVVVKSVVVSDSIAAEVSDTDRMIVVDTSDSADVAVVVSVVS
jgi:hypothetical protein